MDGPEVVVQAACRATPDLLDRPRLKQAIVSQDAPGRSGLGTMGDSGPTATPSDFP